MERRHNNLDIMRLVAAIFVIFSHAFPIVGTAEPRSFLNPTGHSWGNLGVLVFFSISGYLIAGSWAKDPVIRRYWAKRALRLWPGLLVATVMSVWVLGPFFTNLTLAEYFSSPATWLYPIQELLLFTPAWFEPAGVFAENPITDINASLWTLPIEVACYFGLTALFLLRLARPVLVLTGTVVFAFLGAEELQGFFGLELPASSQVTQAATFTATFLCGTVLFLLKGKLPLNVPIALIGMSFAVALGFTPFGALLAPFLVAYAVLAVGLKAPVIPLGRLRGWDLSYGTYIFAFPVEQAVRSATGTDSPWFLAVISTSIVLPLAALSWRFVEQPALARAPRKSLAGISRSSPD